MSVYINDMAMPKGCAFCKLKRRNGKKMVCPLLNEEWDIRDPMSADSKLENCLLIPAADVRPVVRGTWEESFPLEVECSCCKFRIKSLLKLWYKFCPNCGAKMEES